MTRRPVTWVAWAWLTLLSLMLLIPLLGIAIDQAAAITALLFPTFAGALLGAGTLLIFAYFRKQAWALPASLGGWGLMLVFYHRQMGLVLAGGALGAILAYFRVPLGRIGAWLWAKIDRWRKRRKPKQSD